MYRTAPAPVIFPAFSALFLAVSHRARWGSPGSVFNGSRCKYTLISMNNTSVLQKTNGQFEKNKRSEARTSVLPEEATHFGDAVDKRIWTKYNTLLKRGVSFVDPRF